MDEDTKGLRGFRAFAVRVQDHMVWYSLNAPWVLMVGGMVAGAVIMAAYMGLAHWAPR
jgi:hypothetical protein